MLPYKEHASGLHCDFVIKTKADKMNYLNKQRGLSLIELMIAMGLGVLLLLGLVTVFMTANQSSKRRSISENLDETARQVISRLEYDLHNAGYLDPFSSAAAAKAAFDTEDPQILAIYARQTANLNTKLEEATPLGKFTEGKMAPLLGCNGNFNDTLPSVGNLAKCQNNAFSLRQGIQMGYQSVAPDNIQAKENSDPIKAPSRSLAFKVQEQDQSFSGAGRDCLGRKIIDTNGLIINRYDVRDGKTKIGDNVVGSFGCSSSVGEWQGIVEGVEEMVFRYLVTPDNKTAAGEKIVFKDATSGLETLSYLPTNKVEDVSNSLKWASVVGVEVCIIVAVEPVDGTRDASFSAIQTTVPTCARQDINATEPKAPFKADIARRTGDSRYFKRYVQIITMPNSLYVPELLKDNKI